jgi:flagellar biosynthesis protein FlhG
MVLVDELDRISDHYDFLIFDTGAGISSNVTYFCTAAHEIILIVTTEPTSMTDAYALIKVLNQKHGQKRFRLVINSVKSEKEALEVFRHLSAVTDRFLNCVLVEYLGYIVADANVPKSVRQQKPFMELYPYSRVSGCIYGISDKIIAENAVGAGDAVGPFFWNKVFPVP